MHRGIWASAVRGNLEARDGLSLTESWAWAGGEGVAGNERGGDGVHASPWPCPCWRGAERMEGQGVVKTAGRTAGLSEVQGGDPSNPVGTEGQGGKACKGVNTYGSGSWAAFLGGLSGEKGERQARTQTSGSCVRICSQHQNLVLQCCTGEREWYWLAPKGSGRARLKGLVKPPAEGWR